MWHRMFGSFHFAIATLMVTRKWSSQYSRMSSIYIFYYFQEFDELWVVGQIICILDNEISFASNHKFYCMKFIIVKCYPVQHFKCQTLIFTLDEHGIDQCGTTHGKLNSKQWLFCIKLYKHSTINDYLGFWGAKPHAHFIPKAHVFFKPLLPSNNSYTLPMHKVNMSNISTS